MKVVSIEAEERPEGWEFDRIRDFDWYNLTITDGKIQEHLRYGVDSAGTIFAGNRDTKLFANRRGSIPVVGTQEYDLVSKAIQSIEGEQS